MAKGREILLNILGLQLDKSWPRYVCAGIFFLLLCLASSISWGGVPTVKGVKTGTTTRPTTFTPITVTFSESVDLSTLNGSNVSLTGPNSTNVPLIYPAMQTPNAGNSQWSDVVFQPAVSLAFNTPYTFTMTTGVKSSSTQDGLASNSVTPFTTVPAFVEVTPKPTDKVAVGTAIKITFGETMDLSTINGSNVLLKDPNNNNVPLIYPTVQSPNVQVPQWSDVIIRPATDLAYGTTYTLTLTTGVKSSDHVGLPANITSQITTIALPVLLSSKSPPDMGTGVPVTSAISATFNQAMNASTLTQGFILKNGATVVPGTVTYNAATATFTPSVSLAYNTTYTATILNDGTVKAAVGTPFMSSPNTWTFTTQPPPQFGLTVGFAQNSGAGTVNSMPAGIACDGQAGCLAQFDPGTSVTLNATPVDFFAGWSGACNGTDNCQVTMNAAADVTAAFDHRLRIRENLAGFDTFTSAYGSWPDGIPMTIEARVFTSNEDFICNKNISVTMRGGYDKIYENIVGSSVMSGTLTVGQGALTLDKTPFIVR